jgi:hypothetical protein
MKVAVQERYELWNRSVMRFTQTLGVFDYKDLIPKLRSYIFACMGGFSMVPGKKQSSMGGGLKKNTVASMRSGLRTMSLRCIRFAARLTFRFCGE